MVGVHIGCAVACFLWFARSDLVSGSPTIEGVNKDKAWKYEEYPIEHAVSSVDAKETLKNLDVNTHKPPTCQKCTATEIRYCQGEDLIHDHCCCDRRYHELFPYIPHTCYMGVTQCRTIAKDCAEYRTIKICCCDRYALEFWKSKATNTKALRIENYIVMLCAVNMYYIFH